MKKSFLVLVCLFAGAAFADAQQCWDFGCSSPSSPGVTRGLPTNFYGFRQMPQYGQCQGQSCSGAATCGAGGNCSACPTCNALTAAEAKAGYLVTCSGEKIKPSRIENGVTIYCSCTAADTLPTTGVKLGAIKDAPPDQVLLDIQALQAAYQNLLNLQAVNVANQAAATAANAAAQAALTAATTAAGTAAAAQTTAASQVQTDAQALIQAIQNEYLTPSLSGKAKK